MLLHLCWPPSFFFLPNLLPVQCRSLPTDCIAPPPILSHHSSFRPPPPHTVILISNPPPHLARPFFPWHRPIPFPQQLINLYFPCQKEEERQFIQHRPSSPRNIPCNVTMVWRRFAIVLVLLSFLFCFFFFDESISTTTTIDLPCINMFWFESDERNTHHWNVKLRLDN